MRSDSGLIPGLVNAWFELCEFYEVLATVFDLIQV